MQIQRLSVLNVCPQPVGQVKRPSAPLVDRVSLRFGQAQPLLPPPNDPVVGGVERVLAMAHQGNPQAVTGLIQRVRANRRLLGPLSLKSGQGYLLHRVIQDAEIPAGIKAKMVDGLIEAGADPNQRVMSVKTGELTDLSALSLALFQNEAPVLAALKKHNAFLPDIGYAFYHKHPDDYPYDIREWLEAQFKANRELVERLLFPESEETLRYWVQDSLQDGAQPAGWVNIDNRLTPYLHLAYPYLRLLDLMHQKGVSLEIPAGDGNRLLHVAIEDDNMRVFLWLLEQGVNLEAENRVGMRPLYLAVARDAEAMIRQLLQRGVDVNAPDVEGNTPLHMANSAKAVELLAEAKADLQQKNRAGETPLLMALRTQKPLEVIEALLLHGASMDDEENRPEGRGNLWLYRQMYPDKQGLQELWKKMRTRRLLGEAFLARLQHIYDNGIDNVPPQKLPPLNS